MSEATERLEITAARALNPRALRLEFSNGEVRLFDSHRLRGPQFIPLMNEAYFTRPVIRNGNLGWEDLDVIADAQYVYNRSVLYDDNAKPVEYVPTKKDIRQERIAAVLFPAMALAGIIGIVAWYMSL
jgi:hypothetical protein